MSYLILIVDDSPDVTQVVSTILRHKGYEAITAGSGAEALQLMERRVPDLILCDILMPEMDGFQVFQRVRADRRWRIIPFAFLTALTDSETRMSGTELGVEAFITKPFRTPELISVISGLLRRAEELQTYSETEMESFKSQLLFMITHELNTPLSVIRMLTDSMRSNYRRFSSAQMSEYLDLMARSTNELSSIVESMLLALQIDSGKAKQLHDTWAAPFPVRSLLDAVLAKMASSASERGVSFNLIGFDKTLFIDGHEEQLRQVFTRILDNSIRFSPKGGTVSVRLATEGDFVAITFADQGPGMTPDEIDAAFDRLRQINRAQQEQQGVGLSLNLVRALVEIHGGEIKVQSEPGKGSSFTVLVPRGDEQD